MEPLAAENKKLKEARNLSEKNIQRAQCERDLAKSNAWDLEYQKGVLIEKLATVSKLVRSQSEQLAAISDQLKCTSEQLERKSEQLNSVSKQKAEQDAELGQMHQTIDQLCQEKAKEAERANKLAEELKGEFLLEAKVQKENFDTVVAAIKPVLDCIDLKMATQHDGRQQHPNTVIQRCKSIEGGFTEGLSDAETQQLEDEVEDATKMLASNIDLFRETDGSGEAQ
ncbi:MAR-binding filament-like protein 1 [Miscanthus floridulus]|uniref:MAR-binding filament-like protein 1 n=1 Tax=Miscanthus floridulus TaxID=154761 RepID=UPI0034579A47